MTKSLGRKLTRIAVLFSGGDAPGMNAFLRVLVRLAINRYGIEVLGIKSGYAGPVEIIEIEESCQAEASYYLELLASHVGRAGIENLDQQIVRLDRECVSGIIDQGGIILGSARCPEYKDDVDLRGQVIKVLDNLEVDAVVVVGGDGSLRGAADLVKESSMLVVGVPATIDNDYELTESSLGWDTAVNTVVRSVRDVNDTARSHRRIMVLQTMGRSSGLLAETAALASGAEIVVTPERGLLDAEKLRGIAKRIERSLRRGRTHFIVLVAEGVKLNDKEKSRPGQALTDYLEAHFKKVDIRGSRRQVEVRLTVLGHVQRGGSPSGVDRLLAADLAEKTLECLIKPRRKKSGVLCVVRGRIERRDFDAPALPYRKEQLKRIYQLQKDISDPGREEDKARRPKGKRARPSGQVQKRSRTIK